MDSLLAAYADDEDDARQEEEEELRRVEYMHGDKKRSMTALEASCQEERAGALTKAPTGKKARVESTEKAQQPAVRLPPPPTDLFGDSTAPSTEAEGGSAAHLGRVRSFPHIEGNYPTFVYIPVYITAVEGLMSCADGLLQQFRDWLPGKQVHSISELRDEGGGTEVAASRRPLEMIYHVSISRTVGVRQHQIDPLIELLRSTLTLERSFEASFAVYEVFTNDEHTRSFVCSLIAKVDEVFKQFRLPTYYEDPRPHMTIGWTLGDVLSTDERSPSGLRPGVRHPLTSHDVGGPFRFRVGNVQCTPGRLIYNFPLQ